MSNGIEEYFGRKTIIDAMDAYWKDKGYRAEVIEEMTHMAHNNKDKLLDIVCDYMDKNMLPLKSK